MLDKWHKKEKPVFTGIARGVGGFGFGAVVLGAETEEEVTGEVYDYANVITGLSKAAQGAVASGANVNQDNGSHASWTALQSSDTVAGVPFSGTQFTRYISWYKGSSFEFGGIAITSGHNNTTDPLPAKDVAVYTSTDTTDGQNGTWTIQTPKYMRKSYAPKHGSATNYLANRTSSVSSNHVVLGGNLQKAGDGKTGGGTSGFVYNQYGTAPVHDRIYFDPVTVKGVRLDIRSRWDNGNYASEKPHINTGYIFGSNNYLHDTLEIELEDDSKTTCYIDPGLTTDNINFVDQSGNSYDFATNDGNNRGTVQYNSGNGGHIQISGGSLRNGLAVARGGRGQFSFGCWVKIQGGSTNNGGGVIWYGSTTTDQHVFVRNSIATAGCMAIGADIQGNDEWVNQNTKDQRVDAYISSVGVSNWFFLCLRYHSDGLIETSWDGRPFDLQFTTDRGRASNLNLPFGVGGDPYNDNDSSHDFGPFFFYTDIIPYGRVIREWDRYKTRFGRTGDPDYTTSFN